MSVAYEQSSFSLVGARVRRLVLGIVLFASLAVNVVFAICTLVNPVSLYAVLVFALIVSAIGYLVEFTLADAEEVADAVMSDVHPALLRAPVCMSYEWIIGAWLAWWIVTQLMWAADIVYQSSLVSSLIVVPMLLAYMVLRLVGRASAELWTLPETLLLLAIQLVTFTTLLFPSTDWAPQYISVLAVCARVLLFFAGVMLATFLEPPHWDVSLDDEPRPFLSVETEIKNLMQNALLDNDSTASSQQRQRRFERARAMLAAHARTAVEQRRMRNIVALTAWVLVLPLRVVLVVYPLLLAAMIYDSAKTKRVRTAAPMAPALLLPLSASSSALPHSASLPQAVTPASVAAAAATPAEPAVATHTINVTVPESRSDSTFNDKTRFRPAVPPPSFK